MAEPSEADLAYLLFSLGHGHAHHRPRCRCSAVYDSWTRTSDTQAAIPEIDEITAMVAEEPEDDEWASASLPSASMPSIPSAMPPRVSPSREATATPRKWAPYLAAVALDHLHAFACWECTHDMHRRFELLCPGEPAVSLSIGAKAWASAKGRTVLPGRF